MKDDFVVMGFYFHIAMLESNSKKKKLECVLNG